MSRNAEHIEQKALFQWAAAQTCAYPELRLLHAIPNGGLRSKATAGKLKAEGVKPGVPDVCLPVARGRFHGCYIELKAGRNRASEHQERWIADLTAEGYFAICVTGWFAAKDWLVLYLHEKA